MRLRSAKAHALVSPPAQWLPACPSTALFTNEETGNSLSRERLAQLAMMPGPWPRSTSAGAWLSPQGCLVLRTPNLPTTCSGQSHSFHSGGGREGPEPYAETQSLWWEGADTW